MSMTDNGEPLAQAEALILRVEEALGKDVGRGAARVDPKDLARIGAAAGDILSITGERRTVARAMPAHGESRGKGIIQIDWITRENARIGAEQPVLVRPIEHAPAVSITLRPVSHPKASSRGGASSQGSQLSEGLPLVLGDRVWVNRPGARVQELEVVSVSPKDRCVVLHPKTRILIGGEPQRGFKAEGKPSSYEHIGGLHKEIRRVREMVELPLRYPQLFERLGIDAPKGVLLHGTPGTGKTLLARAVAHQTEAAFISVSGPEIIHKFYGESEAKLRGIFEQARKSAPCILFLDELEAIAPKRENVQGDVEKRVVAQLLSLMDGLEGRGQIIVIGATNLPNLLDPALRRPGRFDREIEIGIPDALARREILEIHTRGMPLADDVDIDKLASVTHGFVGADLEALCREAAMTTIRAILPEIDLTQKDLPEELAGSLKVAMSHFTSALAEVEPSAVREVFVEVPDVTWDQIGGLASIKRELREAVEWPLERAELLRRADVRTAKGILLYGPPGTGKSLLAKAVASQTGVNFISVKGPALLSKYIGESEKGVREIFKKARQAAPCILFFDEIDALAPHRSHDTGDAHVSQRVISQLLTEMDGIEERRGVLVMAATNRRDMLDPALLRPGRFDLLLGVPLPDREGCAQIVEIHTKGRPLADDVRLADLAALFEGLTGADIAMVCQRAAVLAVREFLARSGESCDPASLSITRAHFAAAMEELHRRAESVA